MSEHPIEGLMTTAMSSIQNMIDVNTIIGEPIETSNNMVIIPISKVSFGFAAGGSEFKGEALEEYNKKEKEELIQYKLPFGGGSGAGVTINPVAFLVVQSNTVKLLPVEHSSYIDRLLDYIPDLMERTNNMMNKIIQNKKQETEEIIKNMKKINDEKQEEHKKQIEEDKIKVKKEKQDIDNLKEDVDEVEFDEDGNIINEDD